MNLDFGQPVIYHIGISGGKDSTALLLWAIHKSGIPKDQIRVCFSDTGNEDPLTYEHLRKIHREIIAPAGLPFGLETLIPAMDFFELAFKKNRFPSRVEQFCTIFLKIEPAKLWLMDRWNEGFATVVLNGKRVGESKERRKKMVDQPVRGFSDYWGCEEWMPLRDWSLEDVFAIHREFNFPLNPLYDLGASRVGCWPCVNCGKKEIRLVAKHRPEKIELIHQQEQRFKTEKGRVSTFFHAKTAPAQYRTERYINGEGVEWPTSPIKQIVKWAHTKRGGEDPTSSRRRGDKALFPWVSRLRVGPGPQRRDRRVPRAAPGLALLQGRLDLAAPRVARGPGRPPALNSALPAGGKPSTGGGMLTSAWRPIAEGTDGIRQILHHLRTLKDYYGAVPAIRGAALRIAGSRIDDDQVGQVQRLASFVRRAVVYQADPWNAEFVQSPDVLLLAINARGHASGDCDDHVLLFASLAEALGIYTEIVGVVAPGGGETWNHVIATTHPGGQPMDIDLCAKGGWEPVYENKLHA